MDKEYYEGLIGSIRTELKFVRYFYLAIIGTLIAAVIWVWFLYARETGSMEDCTNRLIEALKHCK